MGYEPLERRSAYRDRRAECLSENRMAFDRARTLQGRSTRMGKIVFQVHAAAQSSLVNALSTAHRAAARRAIDHVIAGGFDLRHHLASGQEIGQFVTLFDDASDVRSSEAIRLAEGLSIVTFGSRPIPEHNRRLMGCFIKINTN